MEHIVKLQIIAELRDKVIEQQAKELEALRGFSIRMKELSSQPMGDRIIFYLKTHGLMDRDGNPTKLLTGDK